ncbi:MAG: heme-binding protein [Pseudomonadota bacterium]
MPLSLADANRLIEAAMAEGQAKQFQPLSVCVLDEGGHVQAFQRADGASMMRFEIAKGKAYGALAVGKGSRWLNAQAEGRPHFLEGLSNVSGGKIVPVPGGVLIKDEAGTLLGAVGITGDTSDNDEIAALAGITAIGKVGVTD